MGYWQEGPDVVTVKGVSMIRGEQGWAPLDEHDVRREIGVVKAFLEDNDLVEMTVTSACIGFSYTFRKSPSDQTGEQHAHQGD